MTTYYVKNGGSDAANGTSYGTAWLTIGKALGAAGIASGDTLYVAPGTYREVVTVAMTSAVATTSIIADVDGSHTDGVGGDVIWTAYTTNDTSAPSASALLNLAGRDYLKFTNFVLYGGTNSTASLIDATTTPGSTDITLQDCVLIQGLGNIPMVSITGVVDVASNWTISRCQFWRTAQLGVAIPIAAPTSASADYNLNVVIRDCSFVLGNSNPVNFTPSGAAAFKPGGISVINCINTSPSVFFTAATLTSKVYPIRLLNNIHISGSSNFVSETDSSTVVEENTLMTTSLGGASGVAIAGTNSAFTANRALAFEFGRDIIAGRAPRHPLTPAVSSPYLGFGNHEAAIGKPGTIADDNSVGTVAWNNPTNASYPDATNYAVTDAIAQNALTHWLKFTNFGFAIPATATITGIRLDIKQLASAASSVSLNGNNAGGKLVKAGTIGGTLQTSATNWGTGDTFTLKLGGPASLWGQTLTYSDVNDSTFGVAIAVTNSNAATRTASVDYVRMIVFYTDTAAGTTDLLNRPRPAGGASISKTLGAFERHDTGILTTSTTQAGSNALDINGPGDHDFQIPVNAAATTIKVYARYDGTYSGTLPCATLLANPTIGVTTSTATMVAAANTWEQLTIGPFTPTAAGVVTVRLRNQGTTVSGHAYFDTWSVT